MHCPKKAA
jgi:predicted aspartyl protease